VGFTAETVCAASVVVTIDPTIIAAVVPAKAVAIGALVIAEVGVVADEGFAVGTVRAASVVVNIDPTVVAAGASVVALDAVVETGRIVVANGPVVGIVVVAVVVMLAGVGQSSMLQAFIWRSC